VSESRYGDQGVVRSSAVRFDAGATNFAILNSESAMRCQGALGYSKHSRGTSILQVQTSPKVAILLCTFNGERYLADQLESLAAQTHANWEVWASDDGSKDATQAILETYKSKWESGRLSIHLGPRQGFAANFLSITRKASTLADYFAFSDQDDIWEAEKLQRAIDCLQAVPRNVPALYCSRTRVVDANNKAIGFSPLFKKTPSFANALIQNIGGGNTMVFNGAARELMQKIGENKVIVAHDWWAYLVVCGCGGKVFYDAFPSLRYRQHDGSVIGVNATWSARLIRIRMMFQGRFRDWIDTNIEALQSLQFDLTPENREILDRFAQARSNSLIPRLIGLKRSGIYRQTLFGNLGLFVAGIFKKI